jgi:hypothetical protein
VGANQFDEIKNINDVIGVFEKNMKSLAFWTSNVKKN